MQGFALVDRQIDRQTERGRWVVGLHVNESDCS